MRTAATAHLRSVLLGLTAAALFGAAAPACKALLGELPPWQLAGLLYLGAALGVAPWAFTLGVRHPTSPRNRWMLAGAVVLGGIAGPVLMLLGLRTAEAGAVAVLLNLELVATALFGWWIFRENFSVRAWIGIVVVVGAGVLATWSGAGGSDSAPAIVPGLLVAAACMCWGMDNHLTALIDGIPPVRTTLFKGLVAGTFNLGIGFAFTSGPLPWVAVLGALAVGAVAYGWSIVLWIESARHLGATRAQVLFSTAPFFGGFIALLFLDATWSGLRWLAFVGAALGVVILLRDAHAHEHEHEELEHDHAHIHDDGHHDHAHPEGVTRARHSHAHRHAPRRHAHPHVPDLHHRHRHG